MANSHRSHWIQTLALVLTACGSEAMGDNSGSQASGNSQDVLPGDLVPGGVAADDPALTGRAYVYTATADGRPPNADYFSEPRNVYVFGFVPDGEYHLQVTDLQCNELLAGPEAPGDVPDTAFRVVKVRGGEFGPVAVSPFLTAVNDGSGRYRVHLSPTDAVGLGAEGCYGFKDESTYAANFSLVPGPLTDASYCATGGVFYGETPSAGGVEGMEVALYSSSQGQPVAVTYSGRDGLFTLCGLKPGEVYEVGQALPQGWSQVAPAEAHIEVENYTRDDIVINPFRDVCTVNGAVSDAPCAL